MSDHVLAITLYGSLVIGNWPNTVAKNASGPGATDGTPYTADFISDLWGARQDLLSLAGMVPDGITEAAGTSQFMEALRRGAGLPPGMAVDGFFSPARQALMRLLPLEGQLVPVAVYDKLTDAVWQGAANNNTVPAFYRCDPTGTRNAAGTHLYLPDARGLFTRAAGVNSIYKAANDTPYDGKEPGDFIGDASRRIVGDVVSAGAYVFGVGNGTFELGGVNSFAPSEGPVLRGNNLLNLDTARVTPVAHENRSASLSDVRYIAY